MAEILDIDDFLVYAESRIPVVDVRSPGEHEKGHIPGAINIPLFSNEEREIVGTKYKQINREAAMFAGLEFIGKKMVPLVKEGMKVAGRKKELLVHCWRGGMRSESMAWLFGTVGLECYLLRDGYKTYRKHLREQLGQSFKIIIVGGKTGTGKTEILKLLKEHGEQVIDLEFLANHKGSAFGALGESPQPSTEHFENLIYQEIRDYDPGKKLWIEDESRNIGKCVVPPELYFQMRQGKTLFLDIPQELRAERLVKDYALFKKSQLKDCVLKISKKLGGDRTRESIESIENGEFHQSAVNMLEYYDKAYMFSLERNHDDIIQVSSDTIDPEKNMKLLLEHVNQ